MTSLSICEYDKVYPASTSPQSANTIPDSAFRWLETLIDQRQKNEDPAFIEHHGRYLKLKNYVGLIEAPCGTTIEILPKTTKLSEKKQRDEARKLLWKMLSAVHKLPSQKSGGASLEKRKGFLLDLLIQYFLQEVTKLLQQGIRSDYLRMQVEKPFIKGRLRIAQQVRQPLSRQHHFHIEYDCFLPDRPENRLIKSALQWVVKSAKTPDNQRLARELLLSFDTIPQSSQIKMDLIRWSKQRDMIYYRPVKPWIELILLQETPWFLKGKWEGISFLFPMEMLFEKYVELLIRRHLPIFCELRGQQASHSLVTHNNKPLFLLKPDMTLYENEERIAILDAKWKRLDHRANKYGLSQSDFYQLFAYGHKYLKGIGNLLLVYPKTKTFPDNLHPFYFDEQKQLVLWVVAFCLKTDTLCIPDGAAGLTSLRRLLSV